MIEAIKFEKPKPASGKLQISGNGLVYYWKNRAPFFICLFVGVWLCGWTVGGFFAMQEILQTSQVEARLFLMFWLVAWAGGWCFAVYQLASMLFGSQRVTASKQALTVETKIGPVRQIRHYKPTEIGNFRWAARFSPQSSNSFSAASMTPTLNFFYGSKTVKLFNGISEPEALALIPQFKEALQIKEPSE